MNISHEDLENNALDAHGRLSYHAAFPALQCLVESKT